MNLNELTILLTLNGGKRLPELEEEIFASDIDIVLLYLEIVYFSATALDVKYNRCIAVDIPFLICAITFRDINERWLVAEHLFSNNYYHNHIQTHWYHTYLTHFNLTELTTGIK